MVWYVFSQGDTSINSSVIVVSVNFLKMYEYLVVCLLICNEENPEVWSSFNKGIYFQ